MTNTAITDDQTGAAVTTDYRIAARDGYSLAATLFDAGTSDAVVLINSATGVPRRFYQRFASFIRKSGWSAVTYDYRGIGGSRPRSLRGFKASMRDWAFLDMAAMVDWIDRELAPGRLFAVGHSFGGQTLGMIDNAERIDAVVGAKRLLGRARRS